MIASLPSYNFANTAPVTDPPTKSTAPSGPTDGPPPMPISPALVTDSKLIAYLSSSSIMNGSISNGTQSVWSVLDKLRATRGSWKEATIDPKTGDEGEQASDEDFDDKSVMVYSPLQPNASSL